MLLWDKYSFTLSFAISPITELWLRQNSFLIQASYFTDYSQFLPLAYWFNCSLFSEHQYLGHFGSQNQIFTVYFFKPHLNLFRHCRVWHKNFQHFPPENRLLIIVQLELTPFGFVLHQIHNLITDTNNPMKVKIMVFLNKPNPCIFIHSPLFVP